MKYSILCAPFTASRGFDDGMIGTHTTPSLSFSCALPCSLAHFTCTSKVEYHTVRREQIHFPSALAYPTTLRAFYYVQY